MLTDSALRSQVDALWDKLWSGGLSNPLDAIEQLSFLFFLKRLDERVEDAERAARLRGKKYQPIFLLRFHQQSWTTFNNPSTWWSATNSTGKRCLWIFPRS